MRPAACHVGRLAALRAIALAGTLGAVLLAAPRVAAEVPVCGPEAVYRVAARGLAAALPRGGAEEDHLDWTYVFPAGESRVERAVAILNRALAARGLPPVTMAEITILAPRAATRPCRPPEPEAEAIALVLTGEADAEAPKPGDTRR